MKKCTWYLILTLCFSGNLFAQIFPREGASLHYRIVGFTFPHLALAKTYTLEVARGNLLSEEAFGRNIVSRAVGAENRVVAEVPSFGTDYTWRVIYNGERNVLSRSQLYHFSTGMAPAADTTALRMRILQRARKFEDSYVFLDGNKALYDMDGNPVWYLPAVEAGLNAHVRDLKLSRRGTIIFMCGQNSSEQLYEIDYDGHVLWKGPNNGKVSGDSQEYYHHQFSRIANGHYLAMGTEMLFTDMDASRRGQVTTLLTEREKKPGHPYALAPMCTLIEYDERGNVVWNWKSSEYFLHSDVRYRKVPSGPFDDIHGNAFFFDKENENIYISFRNISRVVKIHYPDGQVLGEYGRKYTPSDSMVKDITSEPGNGIYCFQHSCVAAENGTFYVFNNNACNIAAVPSVVKLMEPDEHGAQPRKIWEYTCSVDEPAFHDQKSAFGSGGNVIRMPEKSLFVNMGGLYSKLFIVTEDKKMLWAALPEQRNSETGKWEAVPQFRANILFRNDLESLIFGHSTTTVGVDDMMITYNTNK